MESNITATEAARSFSEVLNRVRYRGETFVVERGGEPLVKIVPYARRASFTLGQLVELLRSVPSKDVGFAKAVRKAVKKQPKWKAKSPWD